MIKDGFFHGSGNPIKKFDVNYLGIGNEQHGSGFYFTDSLPEASGYAAARIDEHTPKPGGEDNPSVMSVSFSIKESEWLTGKHLITKEQVRLILMAGYELTNDKESFRSIVENFMEIESDDQVPSAIRAASSIYKGDDMLNSLNLLANDFFAGEEGLFLSIAAKVTGYKGVKEVMSDRIHLIVWLPGDVNVLEINSKRDVDLFLNLLESQQGM